ncbi:MAG TPA: GTPase HflX, partial [Atribacterota bacterium]|nr:GTPase HflX [Atribacterota bacterium]
MEDNMITRKERALLIGVNINNQPHFKESIEELNNLAISCEFEVTGQLEQNLKEPNRGFLIGSGKIEEIKPLAEQYQPDVLIFNSELSPSQLRNLSRKLEFKIMDRTSLILEIFARRAKTKEAKLQVEMANLQYMLPRLIGLKESLAQQTGGVGTKTRGLGEKLLELDRRKIEKRITELNKVLESIKRQRETQRKKRKQTGLPTVALVGYTNSGKSTLMNTMLELFQKSENKKVFEDNMLFATLETSTRRITLKKSGPFLLMDTVGFISQLPHHLVKAFHSTLEEVNNADLLLHV